MDHDPVSLAPEPPRVAIGPGDASTAVVPDDLRALRAVVEGTAAGVGREFFRSLVRHVAAAVGVPYAAVCEFDTPPDGRVLAFWDRDHVAEDLPFRFTTTPAAEVLHGRLAPLPPGVCPLSPQPPLLTHRDRGRHPAPP